MTLRNSRALRDRGLPRPPPVRRSRRPLPRLPGTRAAPMRRRPRLLASPGSNGRVRGLPGRRFPLPAAQHGLRRPDPGLLRGRDGRPQRGSLLFGRFGIRLLTIVATAYGPPVFPGGFWPALIPASVAPMVGSGEMAFERGKAGVVQFVEDHREEPAEPGVLADERAPLALSASARTGADGLRRRVRENLEPRFPRLPHRHRRLGPISGSRRKASGSAGPAPIPGSPTKETRSPGREPAAAAGTLPASPRAGR
ncbi:hypothetical protein A4R44_08652 [Amycolatopsis sp. M39]|nr:hypothetical protein A4R44_08652 [Amycolatopsis sp. M39]